MLVFVRAGLAQVPAEWRDDLVDQLAGSWKIEGKITGHDAQHDLQADWVLNHRFLRMEEKTSAGAPAAEQRYDAIWFLGYDAISERYVLHLMDLFGGRFSETIGFGTHTGNQIRFVFEYPDGPFRNTWLWSPETKTWKWMMEQKDKNGAWTVFANLTLNRIAKPPAR